MCDLGDRAHAVPHPRAALRDLLDRGRDLLHAGRHVRHACADLLEDDARLGHALAALPRLAGADLDGLDRTRGLRRDLTNQVPDVRRGARDLLGELADVLGDDRKATAVLAGTRRLDRGVQRQQIGLLGDARDRCDDPGDRLALGAERADRLTRLVVACANGFHRRGDLRDRLVAAARELARLFGRQCRLAGGVG